ncbi:hypothetical protein BE221DRAFT_200650 [Ostreococcus tauri]|uniref:THH1/TOM1/TOM3 domain-containing protein n=1 Tax=Ostreococcus tauri TaxID=70448 RepID=A0A1Y5I8F0_OSTTA|nr:hypothetical protein BE221DRAFT_200650 [Ostreococcus tauri]
MDRARALWIVLAALYLSVALACVHRVGRIAARAPEVGPTTQKVFFSLNALAFTSRACALFAFGGDATTTGGLVVRALAFATPTLAHALAHGTISLFWSDVLRGAARGARASAETGARVWHRIVAYGTVLVECIVLVSIGIARDGASGRTRALLRASRLTPACASFAVAVDFAIRGARLLAMLRAFPEELGATRKRKIREVATVALTCVGTFAARGGILVASAERSDAVAVSSSEALNLAYYAGLELAPSALVLYVLRKLPPRRRTSDEDDDLRDALVDDDDSGEEEDAYERVFTVLASMPELTAELAASRHIGDACALRACAITGVAPDALIRASTSSGRPIKRLDLTDNALTSLENLKSSDMTWFSCANNALSGDALVPLGRACPAVRILTCSGNDGLRSLKGVEKMRSIAAIVCSQCGIEDLESVRGLRELNTLALGSCAIRDVGDALSELPSLRKLNLSKQRDGIRKFGLEALKSSRGLRELRLSHNALKTVPACVQRTPNLRILDVGHNQIADWGDVSALSGLEKLEQLTMRGCPIASDPAYVQRIARMCPGLKLLDGRKMRDALRGEDREPTRDEDEDDGVEPNHREEETGEEKQEKKEKKEKKQKQEKKQKKERKKLSAEPSFLELMARNKGKILEGGGAEVDEDEEKDEKKRTGVIKIYENKELKRRGPCGSDALKTLFASRDAGSGQASAWDEDDDDKEDDERTKEPRKKKTKKENPSEKPSSKKELKEMTPEERKKQLRLQRKRGY